MVDTPGPVLWIEGMQSEVGWYFTLIIMDETLLI